MMTPNVMLRLDVEAMRYQIVHAFMSHHKDMEVEIGKAVESVMKDFDFVAIVREECCKVMRESVKSSIAYTCSSIMRDPAISGIIKDGAEKKVREAIERSLKGRPDEDVTV